MERPNRIYGRPGVRFGKLPFMQDCDRNDRLMPRYLAASRSVSSWFLARPESPFLLRSESFSTSRTDFPACVRHSPHQFVRSVCTHASSSPWSRSHGLERGGLRLHSPIRAFTLFQYRHISQFTVMDSSSLARLILMCSILDSPGRSIRAWSPGSARIQAGTEASKTPKILRERQYTPSAVHVSPPRPRSASPHNDGGLRVEDFAGPRPPSQPLPGFGRERARAHGHTTASKRVEAGGLLGTGDSERHGDVSALSRPWRAAARTAPRYSAAAPRPYVVRLAPRGARTQMPQGTPCACAHAKEAAPRHSAVAARRLLHAWRQGSAAADWPHRMDCARAPRQKKQRHGRNGHWAAAMSLNQAHCAHSRTPLKAGIALLPGIESERQRGADGAAFR